MSNPDSNEEAKPKQASPFPKTTDSVWQQVHDAGAGDQEAVGRLCVLYRDAIFAYVRRWRADFHQAEDLTQAFLARILEKNPFHGFERRETKFRSFLLRCLGNFLRDDKRLKRPETEPLADEISAEARSPVSALDLELALEIHHQVARQLEERHANKGKERQFTVLKLFILGTDERYAPFAETLAMTPGNLRKTMWGLREEYHDGFRSAVAQLVTREEIVQEMKYLMGLLVTLPPEILWPKRNPGDAPA